MSREKLVLLPDDIDKRIKMIRHGVIIWEGPDYQLDLSISSIWTEPDSIWIELSTSADGTGDMVTLLLHGECMVGRSASTWKLYRHRHFGPGGGEDTMKDPNYEEGIAYLDLPD